MMNYFGRYESNEVEIFLHFRSTKLKAKRFGFFVFCFYFSAFLVARFCFSMTRILVPLVFMQTHSIKIEPFYLSKSPFFMSQAILEAKKEHKEIPSFASSGPFLKWNLSKWKKQSRIYANAVNLSYDCEQQKIGMNSIENDFNSQSQRSTH